MTEQTTVLQLVLDKLQLSNSISTIDDRISLQKVVCLTQEAGLQLGYGFNWYIRGPYSPALAADYYQLSGMAEVAEAEAKKFVLTEAASVAVEKVKQVLQPPENILLSQVAWLELLASLAFLIRRYRLSTDAAKNKIKNSKPLLYPYSDSALSALAQAGFVLE